MITPEAEQTYQMAADAQRTAVALLRAFRAGDRLAALELITTLTDAEKGNLVGALLGFWNATLNTCEDLARLAEREHIKADDVLASVTLGLASDGQIHD